MRRSSRCDLPSRSSTATSGVCAAPMALCTGSRLTTRWCGGRASATSPSARPRRTSSRARPAPRATSNWSGSSAPTPSARATSRPAATTAAASITENSAKPWGRLGKSGFITRARPPRRGGALRQVGAVLGGAGMQSRCDPSPQRRCAPRSLRAQRHGRTHPARAGEDGAAPRGAGRLGGVRALDGSEGALGAAFLPAGDRSVLALRGAGARRCARALRWLRGRRRGRLLLQRSRHLPVVRRCAHGRHGSVVVRCGAARGAGAAVGAVAAVSRAGAVRVRRGSVRAGALGVGARRVGLLRASGSASGRAAAADGRGGIRAAV